MDNFIPRVDILLLNSTIFIVAFFGSQYFINRALFKEEDLSRARLNVYIFSGTFGFCVLMMMEFWQEMQHTFDADTSKQLWRGNFVLMDLILLVVIPLALLLDFCCGGDAANRKVASRVMTMMGCCCFSVLFMVEAFIFNTYM